MPYTPEMATIARDAAWLPHRYDPEYDAFHFLRVPREAHRALTFLVDGELPADAAKVVIERLPSVEAARPTAAPLHFVFHSAYCCSTLLARALDQDVLSMSLKEPVLPTDVIAWRRRGGDPRRVAEAFDAALTLLAQPFAPGGSVVVKPSNIVNGFAGAILNMRPTSNAITLYTPLANYLGSIARKGLIARGWVRDFFRMLLKDQVVELNFTAEEYFTHTDLQIAALGWLAQHAMFARAIAKFGPTRVRSLDSEVLIARPAETLAALAAHFRIPLDAERIARTVAGPVFTRHSKLDTAFGGGARADEQRGSLEQHGDEIGKTLIWAQGVAEAHGIAMALPAPLLG